MRARHRFTLVTIVATTLLIAWGAFVTSIDAGLAVPDWPSSFNSYDPLNPWPAWWTLTPVLAEHGHRLLGALVGLLTLVLSVWTVAFEHRRWMRGLAVGALLLIVGQGYLGGLRVVWASLDLAVVHACVAQLFFSTLVCMGLFTSRVWNEENETRATRPGGRKMTGIAIATSLAVYLQVILGALLRHPGTGIDLTLAGLHVFWAFVVLGLVLTSAYMVQTTFRDVRPVRQWRDVMLGLLVVQLLLGLTAFFVLLDEAGVTRPSTLQVVSNTAHMVVGALLMASSVMMVAWSARLASAPESITENASHPN